MGGESEGIKFAEEKRMCSQEFAWKPDDLNTEPVEGRLLRLSHGKACSLSDFLLSCSNFWTAFWFLSFSIAGLPILETCIGIDDDLEGSLHSQQSQSALNEARLPDLQLRVSASLMKPHWGFDSESEPSVNQVGIMHDPCHEQDSGHVGGRDAVSKCTIDLTVVHESCTMLLTSFLSFYLSAGAICCANSPQPGSPSAISYDQSTSKKLVCVSKTLQDVFS